ncbi:PDZ domain-containing protein [Rubritalea squalenifaciens DSM 18772]|uniref:PDZ domain-containing protein n=1 Tax=Rubritalea squalenifaciens DSM 18772 TaxID=1123071 RepID=A0A1M6P2B5_9BACT|nr:PDZ domain-containing protein [Rubritalea squalenifaciens]SHK02012.1 PDZ domain-containing protein [Rubritalea squalenifaciens DSM 18772]
MKQILTLTGMTGLALSSSLFAIERPTPVEAPKESGVQVEAPGQKEAIEMPKAKEQQAAAWLGIAGSPVSETLASHIGTKLGVGITLDIVSPESPAAKAGLKAHDVITKLGGDEIKGMDDLRAAIAKHKAGEEVDVDIISGGKVNQVKVTLGERPANLPMIQPRAGFGAPRGRFIDPNNLPQGMFQGLEDAEAKRLQDLMRNQMQQMRQQMQMLELDVQPGQQGADVKRFHLNLQDLMKNGNAKFGGSITMADEQGSVSLKMTDDGKEVEVKDKNGKLLYAGPYETDIDKEAVPDEIRERIDRLGVENNFKGGLRMRLNGKELFEDE